MYLQDAKTRKWSIQGTVIERPEHDRSYWVRVNRTGRVYLRNRFFLKPSKYPQGQSHQDLGGDVALCDVDTSLRQYVDTSLLDTLTIDTSIKDTLNISNVVTSIRGILREPGRMLRAGLARRGQVVRPAQSVRFDTRVKVYCHPCVKH